MTRSIMKRFVLPLVLLLGLAAPAAAVNNGPTVRPGEGTRRLNPGVGIDEKLDAQVPLDLTFRDEDGYEISLGQCVNGKPTVLVLAYYRCPMNCTDVLNGLTDAMRAMPNDFSVGGAFNVLTVSFDDKEMPALAKAKRQVYLQEYGRPGAENGWRFLTGSKESVRQLCDAVGYKFVYDKVFKEYDHLSGVIVLRPDGRVFRYFYGINYNGDRDVQYATAGGYKVEKTTLKMTLVEASDGQVGSLLDKLAMRCYRFDMLENKYALNILLAVRLGGVLTVLLLALAVTYLVRRERRKPSKLAGGAAGGPANPAGRPGEGVS